MTINAEVMRMVKLPFGGASYQCSRRSQNGFFHVVRVLQYILDSIINPTLNMSSSIHMPYSDCDKIRE